MYITETEASAGPPPATVARPCDSSSRSGDALRRGGLQPAACTSPSSVASRSKLAAEQKLAFATRSCRLGGASVAPTAAGGCSAECSTRRTLTQCAHEVPRQALISSSGSPTRLSSRSPPSSEPLEPCTWFVTSTTSPSSSASDLKSAACDESSRCRSDSRALSKWARAGAAIESTTSKPVARRVSSWKRARIRERHCSYPSHSSAASTVTRYSSSCGSVWTPRRCSERSTSCSRRVALKPHSVST
mmetsp:Transcript_23843/g.70912  ORF Transcript_23843/g.70912 Transcript_23843/m.70912 type:complete len:246 (+) Transcript_23843:85-822(+)